MKHYELGVSLHRRSSLMRAILQRRLTTTLVVVLAVFGFGTASVMSVLPSLGRSSNTEVFRKQNKTGLNKKSSNISTTRSSWLRVRPATVLVPSSSPSVAAPTPEVVSSDAVSLNTSDNGVSTQPTNVADTASTVTTSPEIVVTNTAADPVTVSIVQPILPTITVPVALDISLADPVKKDIAMQLVSSAENSSLDWKAQYGYIEDIGDGRGYTGGIIGFCSGTGDMLELVQYYSKIKPGNVLEAYIPALQKVNGSVSHTGLGSGFESAWTTAATDPAFQQAQNDERDRVYFNPAVDQAKKDGLRGLGQFIYYDAMVMHGPGNDSASFGGIRSAALKKAKTPAQGGDETAYLNAFLDVRVAIMKSESAHSDVGRVETEQRLFLQAGNLDLTVPLSWKVYGDSYSINQ